MREISVSRTVAAPPERVREAMADVEAFMLASGFTDATVEGDRLHLTNHVGLATVELELRLLDDDEHALAYEQVEGIFESMHTAYEVSENGEGSEISATTEFALDLALVGEILDATVIKRQRRKEIESQFDWLADEVGGD